MTIVSGSVFAEASAGSDFGGVLRTSDGLVVNGPDVSGTVSLLDNGSSVDIAVSHDVTTRVNGFAVSSEASFSGAIPTSDPGAFAEARVAIDVPFTVRTTARFDLRAGFTGCGGVTLRDVVRGVDIVGVASPLGLCDTGIGTTAASGSMISCC